MSNESNERNDRRETGTLPKQDVLDELDFDLPELENIIYGGAVPAQEADQEAGTTNARNQRVTGTLPNGGNQRVTGTLPNGGNQRVTGTLPNGKGSRVTGTLPNRKDPRVTGTLPNGKGSRVTGTLLNGKDPRETATLPNHRDPRETAALPNRRDPRETAALPNGKAPRETEMLPNGKGPRETAMLPNRRGPRETGIMPGQKKPEETKEKEFSQDEGNKHHFTLGQRTIIGEKKKYVIIAPISYGGQAELYEVADQAGKHYAAKIYRKDLSNKYHDAIVEFLSNHNQPGLMRLLDHGTFEDRNYYIYPLYRKGSLDVTKPEMDERRLKKFITVLNEAIHAMHQAGLIHADIKPANMIYDEKNDLPVLSDFGSVTIGDRQEDKRGHTGNNRSLTGADHKVSEGYTAPYALMYHGASGEEILDLSSKSDYFSLGVSLCEIYMEEPYYKMFHTNVEIALKLGSEGGIPFPARIQENKRFYNLVQALLADSVHTQPGYEEIKAWLNGDTLEIVRTIQPKKGFSYYFDGVTYTSVKDLAEAFAGKNWAACQKELFRKAQFERVFCEYSPQIYTDVMNIIEEQIEKKERPAAAFRAVCNIYPQIDFFWDNKIYKSDGIDGKENAAYELASDIYDSVRSKDGKFDILFTTKAIRTYFEVDPKRAGYLSHDGQEGVVDKILRMAEQNLSRAELLFAELVSPGVLSKKIFGESSGFIKYLRAVCKESVEGGFDDAVQCRMGTKDSRNQLVRLVDLSWEDERINALLCKLGHEEECIDFFSESDKKDQGVFFPLIRVLRYMGKILGDMAGKQGFDGEVLDSVEDSASYTILTGYLKHADDFDFIDNNGAEQAGLIKKHFEALYTDYKNLSPVAYDRMDKYRFLLDDIYEVIGELDFGEEAVVPFLYEDELFESGLQFFKNSCICPKNDDGKPCLLNGRYVITQGIAKMLSKKGLKANVRPLERRDNFIQKILDYNKNLADNLLQDFESYTNSSSLKGSAHLKLRNHVINLGLVMFCAFMGFALAQSLVNYYHRPSMAEGSSARSLGVWLLVIDSVLVFLSATAFLGNISGTIHNLKVYSDNKNLLEHYNKLQYMAYSITKMASAGVAQPLKADVRKAMESAPKGVYWYIDHNNIKKNVDEFREIKSRKLARRIILAALLFTYTALPVSSFAPYMIKKDLVGAIEVTEQIDLKGIPADANNLLSQGVLKLTQNSFVEDLLGRRGEMSNKVYNAYIEGYEYLNRSYGLTVDSENEEKLKNALNYQ